MGIAKGLALKLGGIVALGGIIFIFRDKILKGASVVGDVVGRGVGNAVGSAFGGIGSGTIDSLNTGSKQIDSAFDRLFNLPSGYNVFSELGKVLRGDTTPTQYNQPIPTVDNSIYEKYNPNRSIIPNAYGQQDTQPQYTSVLSDAIQNLNPKQRNILERARTLEGFGGDQNTQNAFGLIQIAKEANTPKNPTVGFFDVGLSRGTVSALPLSQQAIDYYRKLGVGLTGR